MWRITYNFLIMIFILFNSNPLNYENDKKTIPIWWVLQIKIDLLHDVSHVHLRANALASNDREGCYYDGWAGRLSDVFVDVKRIMLFLVILHLCHSGAWTLDEGDSPTEPPHKSDRGYYFHLLCKTVKTLRSILMF